MNNKLQIEKVTSKTSKPTINLFNKDFYLTFCQFTKTDIDERKTNTLETKHLLKHNDSNEKI